LVDSLRQLLGDRSGVFLLVLFSTNSALERKKVISRGYHLNLSVLMNTSPYAAHHVLLLFIIVTFLFLLLLAKNSKELCYSLPDAFIIIFFSVISLFIN